MEDDFLSRFRKEPRSRMKEELYYSLEKRERRSQIMRRTMLATFIFIFLISFSLATLPAVRAATIAFIEDIGGLELNVSAQLPPVEIDDSQWQPPQTIYIPAQEVEAFFTGPVLLPTYIPDDFRLTNEVGIDRIEFQDGSLEIANYVWSRIELSEDEKGNIFEQENFIHLQMQYASGGLNLPDYYVHTEAYEKIFLGEQPAVIIHGVWDLQQEKYLDSSEVQLVWKVNDQTVYTLSSDTTFLSEKDLVLIAESISNP